MNLSMMTLTAKSRFLMTVLSLLLLLNRMKSASCFAQQKVIRGIEKSSVPSSSTTTTSLPAVGALDIFFQTHPFATAFLTGGTQASVADFFAQSRERLSRKERQTDKTKKMDQISSATEATTMEARPRDERKGRFRFCAKRNLSFLLYGGLYQGMANEWIFNTFLPSVFQHKLVQALVAVFFFGSYISLPVAYNIKSLVFGHGAKAGFARYWNDVQSGLLFKFWSVWLPVNCINFVLVPPHYRITVNSIVAFCWLMILSSISSKSASQKPQAVCS